MASDCRNAATASDACFRKYATPIVGSVEIAWVQLYRLFQGLDSLVEFTCARIC